MLRYLRARKFAPQEAFVQFKMTEKWRADNDLETLYETIDLDEYEATARVYPQWTGRTDKRGIPLYVYDLAGVDPKAISDHSKGPNGKNVKIKTPWKMLKLFAHYEHLCRFVLPFCSAIPDRPHPETLISQSNNIVDLTGVGSRSCGL